jgi:hypothetical protein
VGKIIATELNCIVIIEARLVDLFQARDGRRVWSAFPGIPIAALTHSSIKQLQIVQTLLSGKHRQAKSEIAAVPCK